MLEPDNRLRSDLLIDFGGCLRQQGVVELCGDALRPFLGEELRLDLALSAGSCGDDRYLVIQTSP